MKGRKDARTADELTNLFNRSYFDQKLPNQIQACKSLNEKMFVALINLDNFKTVNRYYGPSMEQNALVSVGTILAKYARRGSDWAARYGDDEFFVCFPGAKRPGIERLMQNLLWEIEHTPVVYDEQKIYVTASIGVTELWPEDTQEMLLLRCERMLWAAKEKGKNRIESFLAE